MVKPLISTFLFSAALVTTACSDLFSNTTHLPEEQFALPNVLAHAVVRIATNRSIHAVAVDDVGVFGIDSSRAILYGRYLVTTNLELPNYPESRPFLLLTCDRGQTWTQSVDPAGSMPAGYVNEIRFLDEYHGWISATRESCCGPSSFLLRTDDGGKTWEATPSFFNASFAFWSFESPRKGMAVLDHTDAERLLVENGELVEPYRKLLFEVLRTTNGGTSWEVVHRVLDGEDRSFDATAVASRMECRPNNSTWSFVKTSHAWLIQHSTASKHTIVAEIPLLLLDSEYRFESARKDGSDT